MVHSIYAACPVLFYAYFVWPTEIITWVGATLNQENGFTDCLKSYRQFKTIMQSTSTIPIQVLQPPDLCLVRHI